MHARPHTGMINKMQYKILRYCKFESFETKKKGDWHDEKQCYGRSDGQLSKCLLACLLACVGLFCIFKAVLVFERQCDKTKRTGLEPKDTAKVCLYELHEASLPRQLQEFRSRRVKRPQKYHFMLAIPSSILLLLFVKTFLQSHLYHEQLQHKTATEYENTHI